MILSYFSTRGDECMNKTFKVLLGAAAGYKYIKLDAVGAQVRVAFTTFTFAK